MKGAKRHGTGYQIRLSLPGGKRISPTLDLKHTGANDKHVDRLAATLREKIRAGTFNLAEEFPDYRGAVPTGLVTFKQAAEQYLRLYGPDLAHSTLAEYTSALRVHWYDEIGERAIAKVSDEDILEHRADRDFNSKTWNNILTPVRRVFAYALEKRWIERDPMAFIKNRKLQKPTPDPLGVDEAEAALAMLDKLYGASVKSYFEFGLATGLRSSELIALRWDHVGTNEIVVREARVKKQDKGTKTYCERTVKLVPRAAAVLARMRSISGTANQHVFVDSEGKAWDTYHRLSQKWLIALRHAKVRHRKAYVTRATSVTWRLMTGENVVKVAAQHGHSVQTMLSNYAKWLECDDSTEIDRIGAWLNTGAMTRLKLKEMA